MKPWSKPLIKAWDRILIDAMKEHGFYCQPDGQGWRLKPAPIAGYTWPDLPYHFRTINSAAEHLIHVIRDDHYTRLVS